MSHFAACSASSDISTQDSSLGSLNLWESIAVTLGGFVT